tara:strand:- start:237 stop:1274 length:1038 start_codon:yes stop_codon:yes gene_type:complete
MIWMWLFGCTPDSATGFGVATPEDVEGNNTEESNNDNEVQYGRYVGEYLMTVFSCESSICMEPNTFNHEVWIAYSDDGVTWTFPNEDVPFEGSVPDIIRRDNTLYAFGGRGTIKRYHFDTDEWEDPVEYSTIGVDIRWNDKSPVLGNDGLIHLFFLSSEVEGGDPAECPEDSATDCTQYFRSAIEVEGSDGTIFDIQEAPNLVIDISPGDRASDPDVFRLADGRWGMLITWLEGTAFFVSDTLHGEYLPAEHLGSPPYLADPFYGLGVSHYIPDEGVYWTYVNTPQDIPGTENIMLQIERAVHTDFDQKLHSTDFEIVLQESDGSGLPNGYWAASPGFTFNRPRP